MARFALSAQHLSVVLGGVVMTAKTVRHRALVQYRTLRMLRFPWPTIGRHVPARDDDRIALDGLFVDDRRMTGRAALALASRAERLHVFAMAHDQADVFDRRREVPDGDFGDAQNVAMAAQAYGGIHIGPEIMGLRRRPEQGDGHVSRAVPGLVVQPANESGPDMTRHTLHLLMG